MRAKRKIYPTLFDNILTVDCIELDPEIQEIFEVIEENSEILDLVYKDLCKNLKNPKLGRIGLSAKQVLGFNVLKMKKNLSYDKARKYVADSMSCRVLFDFGFIESVPGKKAFIEATNRLSAETLKQLNEILIKYAVSKGLEKGKKIRTDSTAVESNIHYPTDHSLMRDLVRVITRTAKQFLECYPKSIYTFPNRNSAVGKRSQKISRSKSKSKRKTFFREMIKLVKKVLSLSEKLREGKHGTCKDPILADSLKILLQDYEELGRKIIDQCSRRIFEEEKVRSKRENYLYI